MMDTPLKPTYSHLYLSVQAYDVSLVTSIGAATVTSSETVQIPQKNYTSYHKKAQVGVKPRIPFR